jgi:hypothetical protein
VGAVVVGGFAPPLPPPAAHQQHGGAADEHAEEDELHRCLSSYANAAGSQAVQDRARLAFQSAPLWKALSKTDLILAPPGHSRDEARALIQKTHVNPNAPPHAKKHAGRVAFARSALARLRSDSFEPP